MALLICARTGVKAYQPAFWTLPSTFLTATAAAGSVGFINSVGNLGGFVGPFVMGKVQKLTGSFTGALWFLGGMMILSVLIVLLLFRTKPPAVIPPGQPGAVHP
jgi:ACS family tartrate transporter-like MFS transporter